MIEDLILKPKYSLIAQSLHSREGNETTNGDGFGLGWYDGEPTPGLYKSIVPAWNDQNLKHLTQHIKSGCFLAHVRATTGTPIQQTNCHPFNKGKLLFVHNGLIEGYTQVKRDLVLEIDPELFSDIQGTTDSEIMFYLALTYGLKKEPVEALERMAALVERLGKMHGIDAPLQMTLGITDGEQLIGVRYSSQRQSRTLYYSAEMEALQQLNPDLEHFSKDARAIVSEPLNEMEAGWIRVPESTVILIRSGVVETVPFDPSGY
jgi:glutamine amidotransferase